MNRDIKGILSQMTLEEKAGLCSGLDHWHTKPVERLGIPSIRMSDGPHGLRKQAQGGDHLGLMKSLPATCFPTAATAACSWDRELIKGVGVALGEECQAEKIDILLAPGTNLKRSPLCGRNFEYYSEDPYLSAELATQYINGLQSQGIGASLKHFAANNQENMRFLVDSVVEERTLRELYLASFEGPVKNAQPLTVMCAYNKLNGTYCSESKYLLTDVLREDWGFEGIVVSDWGAVNVRVDGLQAGLELEMPPGNYEGDKQIIAAVKSGALPENVLDQAVERLLTIIFRVAESRKDNAIADLEANHQMARKALGECIVLLKNEEQILPLKKAGSLSVIGAFAEHPRFQGGGSSYVAPYQLDSALEEIRKLAGTDMQVTYAPGYQLDSGEGRYCSHPFQSVCDEPDLELIRQACEAAAKADCAVIFAGLPESYETEGYDRKHLRIPEGQRLLIEAVAEVQKNMIVVLSNGGAIEMPWISRVKGVVEGYLGGQATGGAIADILFGVSNPCGKLAETFPKKLSDTPAFIEYLSEDRTAKYMEGLFIGYRYYEAKQLEPLFPFGFGLSYTTFEYTGMAIDKKVISEQEELTVKVTVKNTGNRAGKEIVQLYIHDVECSVLRPYKELKGFQKVELAPGEEKEVVFQLNKRAFAYYDTDRRDWCVETGDFEVLVGKSSADIVLRYTVTVTAQAKKNIYTRNSSFAECLLESHAAEVIRHYLEGIKVKFNLDEESERGKSFLKGAPLRNLISYSPTPVSEEELVKILNEMNEG